MEEPSTLTELQQAVQAHSKVLLLGGGSKPALSAARSDAEPLSLARLTGILEYNPSEFTFTARSGARLAEIDQALAEHGQYLPFDPPLALAGATLGGAAAAGLSGPGRYRYGGVRDFIVGVTLVDGAGRLVHGGGKVVKNAAGFDIPKLMVGSLGMFGALAELTFKVFPKPPACITIGHVTEHLADAVISLRNILSSPMDADAVEIETTGHGAKVWLRLRGLPNGLAARAERARAALGGGEITDGDLIPTAPFEVDDHDGRRGRAVVKIPVTPARIVELDQAIESLAGGAYRRYGAGGNVLWLAADSLPAGLHERLVALGLQGLVLIGASEQVRLGLRTGLEFERRIKRVLDPTGRFPAY